MLADIARPIALSFCLLGRFWPQLVALVLAGILAGELLMQVAARVALANHMAGLALLTLVALAQLVVTVAMFQVLRPALPHIGAAQQAAGSRTAGEQPAGEASARDRRGSRLLRMVTIALLPFFAYYAAWGFLGDIVRQYSRAALDLAPSTAAATCSTCWIPAGC
jgi:small-conductance mechanosensitive channel